MSIVCDLGSTDQTRYVAEHAGCQFVAERRHRGGHRQGQGRLAAAPRAGRAAGRRLDRAGRHAHREVDDAGAFRAARSNRLPFLARVFSANRALAEGLVITKRQASPLAKNAASAEALARGLAVKQLAAEISPAAPKKA